MNRVQQQERRTAILGLRAEMEDRFVALGRAWDDELAEKLGAISAQLSTQVGAERSHRLDLAKEQRSYVDGLEQDIRRAIAITTKTAEHELGLRVVLDNASFWARLRWLLTGKRP